MEFESREVNCNTTDSEFPEKYYIELLAICNSEESPKEQDYMESFLETNSFSGYDFESEELLQGVSSSDECRSKFVYVGEHACAFNTAEIVH